MVIIFRAQSLRSFTVLRYQSKSWDTFTCYHSDYKIKLNIFIRRVSSKFPAELQTV